MLDVLVIGGGIAGCSAAYFLASEGVEVTLLEQGDLGTRASGANAGSLHAQIPHSTFLDLGEDWAHSFIPTLRLFLAAIDLWKSAEQWTGQSLDVHTGGGLLVATDDEQMRQIERKAAIEQRAGLDMSLLGAEDLRRIAPYLSDKLIGGALCAQEGKANPLVASAAFGAAAERAGARILRRTAVLSIERADQGFTVQTTTGPLQARRIVNAAGAQSADIAAMLGIHLPMQGDPIQVSVTEPVEKLIPHLVYYARAPLTMKQTSVGTILIGGGWPARLDKQGRPVANPHSLAMNLGVALEVMPRLAAINVVRTWAAIVNGTADWKPLIGEVPGEPGFYLCYVPWMGFTGGPAAARLVASALQGKPAPLDLDPRDFIPGQ
jgi:sarcosine oxidase subunit beta